MQRSSECIHGQRHAVGESPKALLRRIEAEAHGAGMSVLRLETGTNQQEAIGLYERMGFRLRGPFGPYATMPAGNIETSLFFEKVLG